MLPKRFYTPSNEDLIYHYCDENTFFSICTNKTIRLSDMYCMNDYAERHWGYHLFEEVATKLISERTVSEIFIDEVDKVFHMSGLFGILIGACFSLEEDILSQWRGYANDGKGFVIGFDPSELNQIKIINQYKVLYDKSIQFEELEESILDLHKVYVGNNETVDEQFLEQTWRTYNNLVAFKNPAFIEEKEIRLIHYLEFENSNNSFKIVNNDSTEEVKYRMKGGTPVAFVDFDFSFNNTVFPIKKVILGPKNDSIPMGISIFLETIGIPNVEIKKSKATYF